MAPELEETSDRMTRDEEISMIVMRTMKAMREQEEERDRKRGQSNQMTKCLRAVMDQQGEFDGKDVTKYLKIYWREVKLHDLNERIAITKFSTLVELEVKSVVEKLIEGAYLWEEFSRRMKEEFLLQDSDRVTQAMFLDWINDRNKGLEPQELLREFNKRLNQLSNSEVEGIKLQKSSYFLRAADSRLRDEMEYALDLLEPKRAGNVDWKKIEEAVLWVSQRRRQRELDEEAISKAPIRSNAAGLGLGKEKKDQKAKEVSKDGSVDELTRLMEGLKILTTKVDQLQGGASAAKGSFNRAPSYNCIWCDDKDHARKDCSELSEALQKRLVKFVGEPGSKKLAYGDTEELIPLNYNRGGMKVLLEKHLGKREIDAAAASFETNVYNLSSENRSLKALDTVQKKRLAEQIRRKSGWDDPVVITAITAEVGAAWDAMLEDKRKADSPPEVQAKDKQPRVEPEQRPLRRKEVHFDTPMSQGPSSMDDQDSQVDLEDRAAKKAGEKSTKKGPGWLLSRDVEMELDPQEIAKKFWKQEVKGFTNDEFFGSLRKDVQDLILSKAKKKRFYKEGPHSMHVQEANEDEEVSTYGLEIENDEVESKEKIACVYNAVEDENDDQFNGYEEARDSFWARGCSECEIEMEGIRYPVRALIDSGSEVNLMSKKIFQEGQWKVDRDIDWKVNSVNRTRNALWGACPDVKIKIGNVIEPINIFVHETLPYPVILGQPFITKLRMESKVLNDGTHMAKVRNFNGSRIVQFPTVLPGSERNKRELRDPEKPNGRWGFL